MNRIMSLNIDHHRTTFDTILKLLGKYQPDVLLLQDVPFEKDRSKHSERLHRWTDQYKVYCTSLDSINLSERYKFDTVIVVKKTIKVKSTMSKKFEDESKIFVFGLELDLPGQSVTTTVFSLYIRSGAKRHDLLKSLNWIKDSVTSRSKLRYTYVLGDTNSYHLSWSTSASMRCRRFRTTKATESVLTKHNRGKDLVKFCMECGFKILNKVDAGPTFTTANNNQKSYVDVGFVGTKAAARLSTFSLIDIKCSTKHKVICLDRTTVFEQQRQILRMRKFPVAEFKSSNSYLCQLLDGWRLLQEADQVQRMNEATEHLFAILDSAQHQMTRTVSTIRSTNNYRFNRRMVRLCRRSRKIDAKMTSLRQNLKKQNTATRCANKLRWKLRQLVKTDKILDSKLLRNLDDSPHVPIDHSRKEYASKALLDDFLESVDSFQPVDCDSLLQTSPIEPSPLAIDNQQVERVLSQAFPRKKHHCPLTISQKIFAHAFQHLKNAICEICKISFHCSRVPAVCQTVTGLLRSKANGGHRVVHQSSPLMKLLEKIASNEFIALLEASDKLNPNIFSRPGGSTHDLIACLRKDYADYIARKRSNKRGSRMSCLTLIKLDIKGAYDNVQPAEMFDNMAHDFGKQQPLIAWLKHYLTTRRIQVADGDQVSGIYRVVSGIFQGSSLANVLWVYLMEGLREGRLINLPGFNVYIYADDIFVTYACRSDDDLQIVMDTIGDRLNMLGLGLSHDKCSMITYAKNEPFKPEVLCDGRVIQYEEDEMNVLGVPINRYQFKLRIDDMVEEERIELERHVRQGNYMRNLNFSHRSIKLRKFVNSKLIPSIIGDVRPMLPVSQGAITYYNELIPNVIKDMFDLSRIPSSRLIRLIFNLPDLQTVLLKSIVKRMTKNPTGQLSAAYTSMVNEMDSACMNRLELDKNMAVLVEMVSAKRDSLSKEAEIMVKVKPFKNAHNFWIMHLSQDRGVYLTCVQHERPVSTEQYVHSTQRSIYFSKLGALHALFQADGNRTKYLVLNGDDRFTHLMVHGTNADWRILELRKLATNNNWTILRTSSARHALIISAMNLDRALLLAQPIIYTQQPKVQDSIIKRDLSSELAYIESESLRKNLSTITRGLCDDLSVWAKSDVLTLRSDDLIKISGWFHPDGKTMTRTDCEPDTLPLGCVDEACKNNRSDLLLHRLYDCPRFSEQRKQLSDSLGVPNDVLSIQNIIPKIFATQKRKILIACLRKLVSTWARGPD